MHHIGNKISNFRVLFIFYVTTFFLILCIPNALFWDDWTLYNIPYDVILDLSKQHGSMFNIYAYSYIPILEIGIAWGRILTFIVMFLSGLCLYRILGDIKFFSRKNQFYITLFFLMAPLYFARVALIDIIYSYCYFLFFLAWSLRKYRLIAIPLFFVSFNTNSLLVFYALPVLHLYYENISKFTFKNVLNFSNKIIFFILLPFIFFAIKYFYFKPYGMYEGYNESFSLGNIAGASIRQLNNLSEININFILFVICFLFSYLLLNDRMKLEGAIEENNVGNKKLIFLVAFLSLGLSILPYWILGLVPTFTEWSSRHQLLMPLGLSTTVVWISLFIGKRSLQNMFLLSITAIFMSFNIGTYLDFYNDDKKQEQMIEIISKNKELMSADLILINDETKKSNAIKREYRFYEWNGLFKKAFNSENRFVIDESLYENFKTGKYDGFFQSAYNATGFSRQSNLTIACMAIQYDEESASKFSIMKTFPQKFIVVNKPC